jgi:hypothetical protein
MKTFIPSILCAGVFLGVSLCSLRADPPPPEVGKVLVLEGDRTLEGDVERVGDRYRVKRAVGETWIPANRVLRLCPDNVAVLNYLHTRTNLEDPDERLRLAQWCLDRGMQEQALTEAQEALKLRPSDPVTVRLLERIKHLPSLPTTTASTPPAAPAAETANPVDLTAEALAQFTIKVQPILMNTCADCHANGRGGNFKLNRVTDGFSLNRKILQQNLSAVIAQVNPAQPQNSRLLTKAISLHGEMEKTPPLANRQAPAYRSLEEWVRLTVASNPQLLDRVVTLPAGSIPQSASLPQEMKAVSTGFASEGRSLIAPALPATHSDETPVVPASSPAPQDDPTPKDATPKPKVDEKARPTIAPIDPYDPDEFNRQEHPERQKPTKKPA